MLRFAANLSLLFTEVPLPERFSAARACGFQAVEIQFPYSLPADTIAELLTQNQLRLVLFNVDADDLLQGGEGLAAVPEKRRQFQAALKQASAYAQLLQPAAINVLPGRCCNADRRNEYLQTFTDNLQLAADTFATLGVKTVFEAINTYDMPGFLIHSGGQMLEVLQKLQHPHIFMQCDIYHLQRMGENAAAFITAHARQIGHIQFADCPGRGQPGTGDLNFRSLFQAIEQSAYRGWIGAEYSPQGATQDSLAWLQALKQPADI